MKLKLIEFKDDTEKEFENPDIADIEREVMALDWDDICSVELITDNTDYIGCSGSRYEEDGLLCIVYQKGKADFITEEPIPTIEEIITVLQEYLKGDDSWKTRYLFTEWRTDGNGDKIIIPIENPIKKTINICFFPVLVMIFTFVTKSYKLFALSGLVSLYGAYLSFKNYWLPNIKLKKKSENKKSISREDYLSD